jgi:hypothetical protein
MAPQVGLEPTTLRLTGGNRQALRGTPDQEVEQNNAKWRLRVPLNSTQFTDKKRTVVPRTCLTCQHAQHEQIDIELLAGKSTYELGRRFGLDRKALARHRDDHLPARMVKAQVKAAVRHADDLVGRIDRLIDETERLKQLAEDGGDIRGALMGVGRLTDVLELLAKVKGEIDGTRVNINVGQDPATLQGYARFRAATRFIHAEDKWERIWQFIAELGPDPITLTMPPDPEPKQPSEGDSSAIAATSEGEREADGPEAQPHAADAHNTSTGGRNEAY